MRVLDIVVLFVLITSLVFALYFLWSTFPVGDTNYENFNLNWTQNLPEHSDQFYPRMRYQDNLISFKIDDSCSPKRKKDMEDAFKTLETMSVLKFFAVSQNPEIEVLCKNINPKKDEEGHFVAGEGGPSEIVNITRYSLILKGKIALFRPEECDKPQVATHELLHALGFNHNKNQASLLFPVTNCEQKIDDEVLKAINDLYQEPALPDLVIEKVSANKTNKYLNFNITVANYGLKASDKTNLILLVNNEPVRTFTNFDKFEIGDKKTLSVRDLHIPDKADKIEFVIETSSAELSKDNNRVLLKSVK